MEIGMIKENNNGVKFKILSKNIEKSTNKHTYYNIEFIDSGYKDCVRSDSINKGLVKDNLAESFCGVGIIGYVNTREHWHEYQVWRNMISRCYCKEDKSYKFYGARGVTVCERWHRFDFFIQDIKLLNGFNQELFNARKLRLDKDILSNNVDKMYSPQTVMWVSDLTNQKKRTVEYNNKHRKYAVFPDGHTEQILNVSDFCKIYGLHRQNVNLCLAGKQKSTKGFSFYKE